MTCRHGSGPACGVRRLTRRQALIGGGSMAATAWLIACGGGKESGQQTAGGATPAPSGLLAQVQDTSAQATPGGIYRSLATADQPTLDPLNSLTTTLHTITGYVYSRLFKYKVGVGKAADGQVEGDLVEAFELPGDGTQLTLKLRPGVVWDERPPTNKRTLDAEDVLFSWKKYTATSPTRTDLAQVANPASPVESFTAPDTRTLVVKLAYPYAGLLPVLASGTHLWIMPREADGGFDPRNETRGSGAWIMTEYRRSTLYTYKRNPNWYMKDRPFMEGVELPIIPEYAAQLAQFRAGNIYAGVVRQEDILQTKKDLPELRLTLGDYSAGISTLYFGWNEGSPFRDERVRKAVSMLIDRDTYIDVFNNFSAFRKEGIDVGVRWYSHISPAFEGFWLNPQDEKALGEGAKYFQFNVGEAKKLLTAAGFPNGFDTDAYHIGVGAYGPTFPKTVEVTLEMLRQGGVRAKSNVLDYQKEYIPDIYFSKGNFKGVALGPDTLFPDPGDYLFAIYHSRGSRLHIQPDAEVDRLIEQQRRELDRTKRIQIVHDIQRYLATRMSTVPWGGVITPLTLSWPWLQNIGVYRSYANSTGTNLQEGLLHYWIDQTKLKR
jgi:peptide/nickel transport system substrate-binding protein